MRLKSFEARGFKSFADKTSLVFEPGITAIVGPNGSGKSNISDAIRWVLGEQSAKYLRGTKMEDVIFSGSNERRAMGMAEVTLNFDNTDHSLPLDFDEVSICRRVFRSGDSEYSINKKPCRLKDVVTLLADTGLGRGSMSMIGQNRIDEILNSHPEDRRTIFEEAAGIAKYRMRKKEAMRKLDDTAANLVRINDIKSEIESRLGPLKEAAEKATKYQGFAGELRKVQVTQFVHRIENIEIAKQKLEDKFKALSDENEVHTSKVQAKEAEGMALKVELDKLNEEYNQLQNILAEKEKHIETLRGQEGVMTERITQCHNNIDRLAKAKEKLNEQLETMNNNLSAVAEQYDNLDKDRQVAQTASDQLTSQREEIENKIKDIEAQLGNFQASVFEGMQEIVNLRNAITGLRQSQELMHRKSEQLKQTIADAEAKHQDANNRHGNYLQEQEQLQALEAEINQNIAKANTEKVAQAQELAKRQEYHAAITAEVEKLEARLNVLENLLKEHEGFGHGVRSVLNNRAPWRSKIIGVVADLFKVEDKYAVAMETALGAALQNIVTRDADSAKAAIKDLKINKSGRATFLPLDTLRIRDFPERHKAVLHANGVLGVAADFVSCEDEVRPAVRFLLGQVILAQDLDSALAAAKQTEMTMRVVTLDGEVVYAGGSMSGGMRQKGNSSFFSRQQEMEQVQKELEGKNKELLAAQEALEEKENVIKELDNSIAAHQEELQKHAVRQAQLVAFLESSAAEIKQAMENITVLTDEKAENTKNFMAAKDELEASVPKLAALEADDSSGKAAADKLTRELEAARVEQASISARYQEAQITLETAKNSTKVMGERMQEIDGQISRLQQELADNETEVAQTSELITKTEAEKAEVVKQQEDLLQDMKTTDSGKEEFLSKRAVITDKEAALQEELDAAKKDQIICQQKLHTVEMDKVKQMTEYDNALEQMSTTYKLVPDEARAQNLVLDMSDTALKKQENSLHKEIEELGIVNIGAIEEYKITGERFEFLNKQFNDLSQAKAQLETVISGINTDMSKRFKEAFEKINEYFATCFSKLFGGGKARLIMIDEADILESGVDIEVQPPGKKLQNLALLSGGERALTVIALLFALFTYQPAPFSILDEIDAPLDEANIDRFAKFLADYSAKTQFIVITHRKGTMEAADVLHGVTMEESGISRLLSVKLADVE